MAHNVKGNGRYTNGYGTAAVGGAPNSEDNVLIEQVFTRYGTLAEKHRKYVVEHQQELEYAKAIIAREQQTQAHLLHLQGLLNRDPYILVLIDGDGMVFHSTFLNQGEAGGKNAAAKLHNAVIEWALSEIQECPADVKIVVRAYANVKGLGEVCTRAGIVDHPSRVEEFVRGFTCGNALFDFTDVGAGKDRAPAKIEQTFNLYLYNYHCRQILLGCSRNIGYARLLQQNTDAEALRRATLLEGVTFEKELAALQFQKKKFPGIFRESKIVTPGHMNLPPDLRPRVDSRSSLNAASGIFTPRTNTPASPYSSHNGISNVNGSTATLSNLHFRGDSNASSAAASENEAGSWAAMARKNAHLPPADMMRPPPREFQDTTIKRNKQGQRVDAPMEYSRQEVQRIKKMKACNQHYIGVGCCHYNAGKADKCPHSHHYRFTPAELKTLRVVARETPCKRGHECDDPKCIYGHQCPFPVAVEGSLRGGGWCLNGESCRFPRSMHGMDTQPVKMVKAVGMF